MMCLNKFHNSQRSDASQELTYRKTHQFGAYSSSMADSRKKDFSNPTHRTYIQAASTCGRCKKEVQTQTTCGACGLIGKVQKFGDCCICLLRDYKTEAHIAEAANQPDKMRACGLYDKQTNADCTSTQNASFHGSSSHKQYSHKGVHARSCPQQAGNIRDSGKSSKGVDTWGRDVSSKKVTTITRLGWRHDPPDGSAGHSCHYLLGPSHSVFVQRSYRHQCAVLAE